MLEIGGIELLPVPEHPGDPGARESLAPREVLTAVPRIEREAGGQLAIRLIQKPIVEIERAQRPVRLRQARLERDRVTGRGKRLGIPSLWHAIVTRSATPATGWPSITAWRALRRLRPRC